MKYPYTTEYYCEKFDMEVDFLAHYEFRPAHRPRFFGINDITCLDANVNCVECNGNCEGYKEIKDELRKYCEAELMKIYQGMVEKNG